MRSSTWSGGWRGKRSWTDWLPDDDTTDTTDTRQRHDRHLDRPDGDANLVALDTIPDADADTTWSRVLGGQAPFMISLTCNPDTSRGHLSYESVPFASYLESPSTSFSVLTPFSPRRWIPHSRGRFAGCSYSALYRHAPEETLTHSTVRVAALPAKRVVGGGLCN